VEVVNTMPRFTITGAAVSSPTWMLRDGGKFFELNGNMAQYIFSVKTMRTKSHVAQQALNRAATQYRTVVMVALQNVADTLNVIQSDARTLDAVAEAAKSEGKKAEQTLKSYEAGSVDFPTLRLAEQNEQLANINLLQARANQLGDGVALFQALGGRWWKREETTDKTAAK
jgi:outer membrane protein TolC